MSAAARSVFPSVQSLTCDPQVSSGAISCSGRARHFLGNCLVYVLLSGRAQGLSVGVNFTPDRRCNFNCVYCDVERAAPVQMAALDVPRMAAELRRTLSIIHEGRLRDVPVYRSLPDQLLVLRHVAISGDGEPTLAPRFAEALQCMIHLRALGQVPCFKIVLITNGSGLDNPEVLEKLRHLPMTDEVWIKLDAGTQAYMNKVNRTDVPLSHILDNILLLGRERPVVIHSMFCTLNRERASLEEIERYACRLLELKTAGARIKFVQISSANRLGAEVEVRHLPLKQLSGIARTVQRVTGLRAEVF